MRKGHIIHGHGVGNKRSPTLRSWDAMRTRCLNKNNPDYKWYGAKGVTICDRWQYFKNFLADMGERPLGTSLDRIDTNGNYCPENCRWADKNTQARNRRCSTIVEFNGQKKSLADWADDLGIGYRCLQTRLSKLHWSVEAAFTTPAKSQERANHE